MNFEQFDELGEELRTVGHKRRQLVEQIIQEVNEGDSHSSKELYGELKSISDHAISIIGRQKQMIDNEVQKM